EPDEPVSTVTDSRGEAAYVYRRLETTVRVQSPGHVTLSLPAETPRMAVRLRPGIAMDGVVTAPDGSPVPACRVRLESPSLVSPPSPITDQTGPTHPGLPDPAEAVTWRGGAGGFRARRVTGRPPADGPWRFQLAAGVTIAGAVTASGGAP